LEESCFNESKAEWRRLLEICAPARSVICGCQAGRRGEHRERLLRRSNSSRSPSSISEGGVTVEIVLGDGRGVVQADGVTR
jgi:hypothetical protein